MSKSFNSYVLYHRNLLKKGIAENPNHFKKQDLVEFDQAIASAKKLLVKENLLNDWQPVVYLDTPSQFLTITEQQLLFKTYLIHESGNEVLLEQISSEIPADVNAAMKSQITAVRNLRAFYDKLTPEQKQQIDAQANDSTKSRMNFKEELEDIEDEINGIYGKLKKGGFVSRTAKRGFGLFQRGIGKLFGGGQVTQSNLEESTMMDELFPEQSKEEDSDIIQEAFGIGADQATQIGNAFYQIVKQRLGGNASQEAVANLMGSQRSASLFQQAAQSVLGKTNVPLGNVQAAVHQAHPYWQLPRMPGWDASLGATTTGATTAGATGAGTTGTTTAGTAGVKPVLGSAGKGLAAKAAGLGLGAKLAIGGAAAGLIAAGAAGVKMRNRRKRIEAMQMLARGFGAKGAAVAPTLAPATVENPPTTPATSALPPAETAPDASTQPTTDRPPTTPTIGTIPGETPPTEAKPKKEKTPEIKFKGKAVMMGNNALGKATEKIIDMQKKNPKIQFLGPEHKKEWENELQRMFKTKTLEEATSLLHALYLMENQSALDHHLILLEKTKKMGFGADVGLDKGYVGPGGQVRVGAQSGFTGEEVLDKAFRDQLWDMISKYWKNKKAKNPTSWSNLAKEMKAQTAAEYTAGDKAKGVEGLKQIADDELTRQQKELEGKTDKEKAEILKQRLKAKKLAGKGPADPRQPVDRIPLDTGVDRGYQTPEGYEQTKNRGFGGQYDVENRAANITPAQKRAEEEAQKPEYAQNFMADYNKLQSELSKMIKDDFEGKNQAKQAFINKHNKTEKGLSLLKKQGMISERTYLKAKIRQMVLKELRAMKRR
jgi:hypothetical protein